MIDTIYIENAITSHRRTLEICARFPSARRISCQHYSEVFNPKSQSFRLQKQNPSLILARKNNKLVLKAPNGYGIGSQHNFYFSHMLNCLYDCRYCFLQGMYQSANYVLFINYEDFLAEIATICLSYPEQDIHFFSGYDCDSLALEPVSGFIESFLPILQLHNNAWLELRTKSTQIRQLLQHKPHPHCIVAFSFTPGEIAKSLEHKAPSVEKRLDAMIKLQNKGWSIGLRFDPLIYHEAYRKLYAELFQQVFSRLNLDLLHSVSLGSFRLPEKYFKKIYKMYPREKLLAGPLQNNKGMYSYQASLESDMLAYCTEQLLQYIPQQKFFPCQT